MKPSLAASLAFFMAVAPSADAQWLNQPTPNIPRTADGKPDLTAPPPRVPDGQPDLSGVWTNRGAAFIGSDTTLTPAAKELVRAREENYLKDRPAFQCRPTGPEIKAFFKRIVQTPTLITILYEDLTYRLIFMDGRTLEPDPERTWMGYSVGRWEGDTLVVDSFGFNDRTWLDARGLPHTEALRLTERYRRVNRRPDAGGGHRRRSGCVHDAADDFLHDGIPARHRNDRGRLRIRSGALGGATVRGRAYCRNGCARPLGHVRRHLQWNVGNGAAHRARDLDGWNAVRERPTR